MNAYGVESAGFVSVYVVLNPQLATYHVEVLQADPIHLLQDPHEDHVQDLGL